MRFASGLGKAFRPGGLPRELSGPFAAGSYRAVYGLVFFVWTTASYAANVLSEEDRAQAVPITLAYAALLALFWALPWERPVGGGGKAALVAFPLLVFALAYMVGGPDLLDLPMAHAALVFGFGAGLLYALALAGPIFLIWLAEAGSYPGPSGVASGTVDSLLGLVIVLALCALASEARRRHEQTQAVLAELESAHAELARHAAKSRELAVSEERARMAREIHDSVGHHLTAVSIQLDAAQKAAEKRPEMVREQVRKAKGLAADALSEVRRSVRALKPLAVEERTGTGALRALVRSFDGAGRPVAFAVSGEERELPPEAELVLYRALQEGLTNAMRHAGGARRISASLAFEPGGVELSVADDGEGAPEGFEEGGFGLAALKERAAAVGGTARAGNGIGNGPGGGFGLRVELPTGKPTGAPEDGAAP